MHRWIFLAICLVLSAELVKPQGLSFNSMPSGPIYFGDKICGYDSPFAKLDGDVRPAFVIDPALIVIAISRKAFLPPAVPSNFSLLSSDSTWNYFRLKTAPCIPLFGPMNETAAFLTEQIAPRDGACIRSKKCPAHFARYIYENAQKQIFRRCQTSPPYDIKTKIDTNCDAQYGYFPLATAISGIEQYFPDYLIKPEIGCAINSGPALSRTLSLPRVPVQSSKITMFIGNADYSVRILYTCRGDVQPPQARCAGAPGCVDKIISYDNDVMSTASFASAPPAALRMTPHAGTPISCANERSGSLWNPMNWFPDSKLGLTIWIRIALISVTGQHMDFSHSQLPFLFTAGPGGYSALDVATARYKQQYGMGVKCADAKNPECVGDLHFVYTGDTTLSYYALMLRAKNLVPLTVNPFSLLVPDQPTPSTLKTIGGASCAQCTVGPLTWCNHTHAAYLFTGCTCALNLQAFGAIWSYGVEQNLVICFPPGTLRDAYWHFSLDLLPPPRTPLDFDVSSVSAQMQADFFERMESVFVFVMDLLVSLIPTSTTSAVRIAADFCFASGAFYSLRNGNGTTFFICLIWIAIKIRNLENVQNTQNLF